MPGMPNYFAIGGAAGTDAGARRRARLSTACLIPYWPDRSALERCIIAASMKSIFAFARLLIWRPGFRVVAQNEPVQRAHDNDPGKSSARRSFRGSHGREIFDEVQDVEGHVRGPTNTAIPAEAAVKQGYKSRTGACFASRPFSVILYATSLSFLCCSIQPLPSRF